MHLSKPASCPPPSGMGPPGPGGAVELHSPASASCFQVGGEGGNLHVRAPAACWPSVARCLLHLLHPQSRSLTPAPPPRRTPATEPASGWLWGLAPWGVSGSFSSCPFLVAAADFVFLKESRFVAKAGLELPILLPQLSEFWVDTPAPQHQPVVGLNVTLPRMSYVEYSICDLTGQNPTVCWDLGSVARVLVTQLLECLYLSY